MNRHISLMVMLLLLVSLVSAAEIIYLNETDVIPATGCIESEDTGNPDIRTFVFDDGVKLFNTCEREAINSTKLLFPSKRLIMYSCDGDDLTVSFYECELDCYDGRCLSDEEFPSVRDQCRDSDGGKDYFTRGYTTSEYGRSWDVCVDQYESETARCVGKKCFLKEYYCERNVRDILDENVKCDYGCSAGACFVCDGCVLDGEDCYSYTSVVDDMYCDENYEWQPLKPLNATCEYSYECDTQFCDDGLCYIDCDGCWYGRECLPYETIRDNMYCDAETDDMLPTRYVGDACEADFQCKTDMCYEGVCRPLCRNGCYTPEWDCRPVGVTFRESYCGVDKKLHPLKTFGDFCADDYECEKGFCDKTCREYTFWNNLVRWVKDLFR